MRIVGTNAVGYPNQRNIIKLPFVNHKVVRVYDLFTIPNHLYFKLKGRSHTFFQNTYYDAGINKYDILHFFNAISLGSKPWVTTFEHYVPRWFEMGHSWQKYGVNQIAKANCKKLIALSEHIAWSQKRWLEELFPEFLDDILHKVEVIHPAQEPLIDFYSQKETSSNLLQFTMIGADFFRKVSAPLKSVPIEN